MEKSRELRPGSGSVEIVVGLLLFAFAILSEMGIIALFHGAGRDGMIAITIQKEASTKPAEDGR